MHRIGLSKSTLMGAKRQLGAGAGGEGCSPTDPTSTALGVIFFSEVSYFGVVLPKSVNFRVIFAGGNMTPISGNVIKNQNMTLSATLRPTKSIDDNNTDLCPDGIVHIFWRCVATYVLKEGLEIVVCSRDLCRKTLVLHACNLQAARNRAPQSYLELVSEVNSVFTIARVLTLRQKSTCYI